MCNKTKNEYNSFFKYCLQIFSIENILVEQKETCFKITGKLVLNQEELRLNLQIISIISAWSFKIYTDFECNKKRVRGSNQNNSKVRRETFSSITSNFPNRNSFWQKIHMKPTLQKIPSFKDEVAQNIPL